MSTSWTHAYRHYLIQYNSIREEFWIVKDGFTISAAANEKAARDVIDTLLGGPESAFGFVVMVRDRGQDEPRMLNKLYPDHASATCVKHNYLNSGRVNSAYVREATQDDVNRIGD